MSVHQPEKSPSMALSSEAGQCTPGFLYVKIYVRHMRECWFKTTELTHHIFTQHNTAVKWCLTYHWKGCCSHFGEEDSSNWDMAAVLDCLPAVPLFFFRLFFLFFVWVPSVRQPEKNPSMALSSEASQRAPGFSYVEIYVRHMRECWFKTTELTRHILTQHNTTQHNFLWEWFWASLCPEPEPTLWYKQS